MTRLLAIRIAAGAIAVIFVGLLYGTIPGFSLPTLGQALWSMGFAQSLANHSLLTIYATNFGAPEPVAMAFGLPGALLASLFIRLGAHPVDAYSLMYLIWLTIAFAAAYAAAKRVGASPLHAYFLALLWLSMPIVWANAGLSMLSVGFALLPLYFLVTHTLLHTSGHSAANVLRVFVAYLATVILSIFMDGYSFMMFAVMSSALVAHAAVAGDHASKGRKLSVLAQHAVSFSIAYFLYSAYIGGEEFFPHKLEYFRAAGLDLAYIAIPTRSQHWIPDLLGLSVERSGASLFGHHSVWRTTFCLPILAAGLVAWWKVRNGNRLALPLGLALLFGFYVSLGPSLKVNSKRMESDTPSYLMPAERAVVPTGNAFIYAHLPGFKQMRLTFRWIALPVFCAWLLLVMLASSRKQKKELATLGLICALTLLNLPHPQRQIDKTRDNRAMFLAVDRELIATAKQHLQPAELVAFLPYRNGWLINYLAARTSIRTFNVGHDKSLAIARKHWPKEMQALKLNKFGYADVVNILTGGAADVVVVTYFNSLTSSYAWPCRNQFKCPEDYMSQYSAIVEDIKASPEFRWEETDYFLTVRLQERP